MALITESARSSAGLTVFGISGIGSYTIQATTVNSPGPNANALQITPGTSNYGYMQYEFTATPTVTVGFAFLFSGTLPSGSTPICIIGNAAGGYEVELRLAPSGAAIGSYYYGSGVLQVWSLANGVPTQRSSAGYVPLNTWVYIEFSYTANGASSTCAVYASGANVTGYNGPTGSGSNLASCYVGFGGPGPAGLNVCIDDLYVGTNVSPIGPCSVVTVLPSSDFSDEWTPASGTATSNLDTLPAPANPSGVSKYVTSPLLTSGVQNKWCMMDVQTPTLSGTPTAIQMFGVFTCSASPPSGSVVQFARTYSGTVIADAFSIPCAVIAQATGTYSIVAMSPESYASGSAYGFLV